MRKMVFGRKLSRSRKSRRALLRNLVSAIVLNGKIITTKAKAKAFIPMVDKIVNLAKKDSVAARRDVFAKLGNQKEITSRIFTIVSKNFSKRAGGYLRITPLPSRLGDASEVVRLEWSEAIVEVKTEPKVSKTTKINEVNKKVTKKVNPIRSATKADKTK